MFIGAAVMSAGRSLAFQNRLSLIAARRENEATAVLMRMTFRVAQPANIWNRGTYNPILPVLPTEQFAERSRNEDCYNTEQVVPDITLPPLE